MKWIWTLLLTCSCVFAFSLNAPTNLRTAAISSDGCTFRWNPVAGASGYVLELRKGIYEDFDSNELLYGWDLDGGLSEESITHDYALSSTNIGAGYNSSPGVINVNLTSREELDFKSPQYEVSKGFSVRVKSTSHSQQFIIKIFSVFPDEGSEVKSIQNTDLENKKDFFSFEHDYDSLCPHNYRFDVSSYTNYNIKIQFDDFMLYLPQNQEPINPSNYHAIRLNALDADTQYYWRVRGVSTDKYNDYSPWQLLQTPAANSSQTAGSVINGATAEIQLERFHQTFFIQPNGVQDADYTLSATAQNNSYEYTISCPESGGLIGAYTIQHPGFSATSITLQGATGEAFVCGADASSFTISQLENRGKLTIVLQLDETLPVELGRFALAQIHTHLAVLEWVSYSESGLNGYRILRAETPDLADAAYISELIPATNSSNNAYYQFRDTEPLPVANYWLEILELSGGQSHQGPVYYQQPQADSGSNFVPISRVEGLFPNPFNPDTTLEYSLKESAAVQLKIYNLRGQMVREYQPGILAAGKHRIVWDGRNDDGRELPSGVYMMRLMMGESSYQVKAMLMK